MQREHCGLPLISCVCVCGERGREASFPSCVCVSFPTCVRACVCGIQVALGQAQWRDTYPMDFYARGGGRWTVRYGEVDPLERMRALRAQKQAEQEGASPTASIVSSE